MGLIKEPLEVDFVVDPRPLTKQEEIAISEFIKADKAKRALVEIRHSNKTKSVIKTREKEPVYKR